MNHIYVETPGTVFTPQLCVTDITGHVDCTLTDITIMDPLEVPEFPFGLPLITFMAFAALMLFRRRHLHTGNVV